MNVYLRSFQASKAEHANLIGDVRPVPRASVLLQIVAEFGAHRDNSIGHSLNIHQPLLRQIFIAENFRDYAGSVDRRIGIHRPDQDFYLRQYSRCFVLIAADQ